MSRGRIRKTMSAATKNSAARQANPPSPDRCRFVSPPPPPRSKPAEALAQQEPQVLRPVAPLLELHLAHPRSVGDVGFAEPEAAEQRLELDFLAEGHAIRRQPEPVQQYAPEHPHAGLAVPDRL